jgi:hypothetical protein
MKLTKQQAVDICGVLRSGEPQDIIAQAREGESLDELIRKLARNRVADIKRRCDEDIEALSARVAEYLNRDEVKEVINNENLSYFRAPRRAAASSVGAGGSNCRRVLNLVRRQRRTRDRLLA